MLDSALQALLMSTLEAGLTARAITGVTVKQNNQPRQAAVPTGPTVFFSSGSRKKYGWPQARDTYDKPSDTLTTTKIQIVHTKFQVAALCPTGAATPYAYTSSDLVSIASDILQDEDARVMYVANDCNVFRVNDLPGIWFQDDKAQNVLWASFDIIFTHKDTTTKIVAPITTFTPKVEII